MGTSIDIVEIKRLVSCIITKEDAVLLKEKVGVLNISYIITERGVETTKRILEDEELASIITTVSLILPALDIHRLVDITLKGFQELYDKDVVKRGLYNRETTLSRQEVILLVLIILYR